MKLGRTVVFAFCTLVLMVFWGCSQSTESNRAGVRLTQPVGAPLDIEFPCGSETIVTLFAGQTIDVGNVTIANNADSLCVTYQTTGDWYLTENHLDIALTPEEIPQTNSGNPRPGQFSYSHTLTAPVQMDEYCFTLSELGYAPGTPIYVAAHSKVVRMEGGNAVQNETAWGDGLPFDGSNWATYIASAIHLCAGSE